MKYEWDESKRLANLAKHKLDFSGAHFIYEYSGKLTLNMTRKGESRKLDLAPVESTGLVLALVYVERGDVVFTWNEATLSGASRSVPPIVRKGSCMRRTNPDGKASSAGWGETDWDAVKQAYDADAPIPFDDYDRAEGLYDPNSAAEVEAAWASGTITRGVRGRQKAPTKQLISIRLSKPVIEHFKKTGDGWQARIDSALLSLIAKGAKPARRKSSV
jgi:uncharacterized protein (DUF4415 family)/uncharacterized DUF497 family protein